MTVTAQSFLAEFPEYAPAGNKSGGLALINAKLGAALLRTPLSVWGALQDEGVKYLAAHLLALSPNAREMQLLREDGSSIYDDQRKILERTVAMGVSRVTGT